MFTMKPKNTSIFVEKNYSMSFTFVLGSMEILPTTQTSLTETVYEYTSGYWQQNIHRHRKQTATFQMDRN